MESLVEICPVVLEKMKMWKVYNNNDNDNGQRTNSDQRSSLEPSAQVSLKQQTNNNNHNNNNNTKNCVPRMGR